MPLWHLKQWKYDFLKFTQNIVNDPNVITFGIATATLRRHKLITGQIANSLQPIAANCNRSPWAAMQLPTILLDYCAHMGQFLQDGKK